MGQGECVGPVPQKHSDPKEQIVGQISSVNFL